MPVTITKISTVGTKITGGRFRVTWCVVDPVGPPKKIEECAEACESLSPHGFCRKSKKRNGRGKLLPGRHENDQVVSKVPIHAAINMDAFAEGSRNVNRINMSEML